MGKVSTDNSVSLLLIRKTRNNNRVEKDPNSCLMCADGETENEGGDMSFVTDQGPRYVWFPG